MGDWRAGYVLLDVGDGDPRVTMIRVPYQLETAMAAIRASELPDEFAEYLQTGGHPSLERSRPNV